MGRIVMAGSAWFACALALLATGPSQSRAQPGANAYSSAQVYVFTELLGSTSTLDGVVTKIRQGGLPLSVVPSSGWSSAAASAIQGYNSGRIGPIVIVGYSVGGAAALDMAMVLNQANVPVQLIVTVEPVLDPPVPPNVRSIINFYLPDGISGPIAPPPNFPGSITNVVEHNPNIDHFTLVPAREDEIVGAVLAASRPTGASRRMRR